MTETVSLFLGESYEYWIALRDRIDRLDSHLLLKEIVELSAKVSYYERHIKQLNDFKTVAESR